jgi:Domain of unknown function (DUF397)
MTDDQLVWQTSSYTGAQGNCVEVARNAPQIHVRDTKDRQGAELTFSREAWRRFTAKLRG